MKGFLKRVNWRALAIVCICFVLVRFSPLSLKIQTSNSVACKALITYKGTWDEYNFDRFGLVVFDPEGYGPLADSLKERGLLLLKHPYGMGGDYLFCTEWGCKVNGIPVGAPLPPDKQQAAWIFAGYIPSFLFAPLGETERSYDVRFAGLASIEAIKELGIACLYASAGPAKKDKKKEEPCGEKKDSCSI